MAEQFLPVNLSSNTERLVNVPELSGTIATLDFECDYDIFTSTPISTVASGIFLLVKFPYEAIRAFDGTREISSSLNRINNHLYRIDFTKEPNINGSSLLTIIGFKPDYKSHGPMRVIDTASDVTVTDIVAWDPARGQHSPDVWVNVDIAANKDPVRFSETATIPSETTWMDSNVGTVWLDTTSVGYVPYYQNQLYSNVTEQLLGWGSLADWSSPTFFQWTKSTVHPDSYDAAARSQEGDITIPADQRAAGYVRKIPHLDGNPVDLSQLHSDFWVVEDLPLPFSNFLSYVDPSDSGSGFPYVEVYVNGVHQETVLLNQFMNDFNNTGKYNIRDHIHLIRSLIDLDTEELYPWVQLRADYITRNILNDDGTDTVEYFFWVENKRIPQNGKTMSLAEMVSEFTKLTIPHFMFGGFSFPPSDLTLPERMTTCYLRNISSFIKDDNRYSIQFVYDESLRDDNRQGGRQEFTEFVTQVRKYDTGRWKNSKHSEWKMFRQNSDSLIPSELWKKLIETCMGVKLSSFEMGSLVPLPSPTLVEYDEVNGTNYSYGIGPEQLFAPTELMLNTVQGTIESPTFSIDPLDKFTFLDTFTFDTLDNIKATMEYIYESFPLSAVNEIFFNCLYEALANNPSMTDIMKTSYLAVHGIKLLESEVGLQGATFNE